MKPKTRELPQKKIPDAMDLIDFRYRPGSCTSELQIESELYDKIWAGLAKSWQISSIYMLQFIFGLHATFHFKLQFTCT